MKAGTRKQLIRIGLVGTVVTAICCFTPALVPLLGALGLAAWTGHLDMVLLPLLGTFLLLIVYASLTTNPSSDSQDN